MASIKPIDETTQDVADMPDVSLGQYLAADNTDVTGYVPTRHGRLKISALVEDEVEEIRRACEKPDPRRGRGATKFDDQQFKLMVAARGLNKADSSVPLGNILAGMRTALAGDVATIAAAVVKLSGFDERVSEIDQAVGFTG